jgi:hypothetical protein
LIVAAIAREGRETLANEQFQVVAGQKYSHRQVGDSP